MRRFLKWLVVIGVLVGLLAGLGAWAKSWWHRRSLPKYLTATVSRGRVESVVNSTGTVKAVRTVAVGAFVSGPIAKVYVDFNRIVQKDQVLAEIDPRLLEAAVKRDNAALETQKAECARVNALLQQAKNNLERAGKLRDINKDYLSDMEMDQYIFTVKTHEAQLALAQASIEQARANQDNSRENFGYTKIVAPEPGVIIERKIDKGQTVAASFQTPELFTIGLEMDRHMYIFTSVDEADVGMIRRVCERDRILGGVAAVAGGLMSPGRQRWPALGLMAGGETLIKATVKFTVDAYLGELFKGTIEQVRYNSTTTQNVVTYPVVIDAPNPGMKLMPGMTANITFQIESKQDRLRVPAAALRFFPTTDQVHPEDRHHLDALPTTSAESGSQRTAGEKAELSRKRQHRLVWVQDGDLLRAVPVTLGLIENQFAELVEGELTEGQAVVTGTEGAYSPR